MAKSKLQLEGEVYYPSNEVVDQARLKDWDEMAKKARRDPQAFWAAEAEELEWFKKWDTVLDNSKKPFFKWFVEAKTNIVHNAIDRHLKTYRKNKLALVWESEDGKTERTFSYFLLNREVSRMANIIKAMGVQKGDRVTIYMGRIPEIVFAMLACAKIGAIYSVVFGGFSVDALQGRAEVLDEHGNPAPDNTEGYLVLKNPWPAMLRTIYGDPDRYVNQYWSKYPGKYLTGDFAKRDKDGYFWIIGRVDDVIKVSGHRLGTAEVESALVSHPRLQRPPRLDCRTRSKDKPFIRLCCCVQVLLPRLNWQKNCASTWRLTWDRLRGPKM